jgi:hypothetical protein
LRDRATGLPDDVAALTLRDPSLEIDEDFANYGIPGFCTSSEAAELVHAGHARYIGRSKSHITHPDLHSHSSLATDDVREIMNMRDFLAPSTALTLSALFAAMNAFAAAGSQSRVVYWLEG